jgi:hypothetical protein
MISAAWKYLNTIGATSSTSATTYWCFDKVKEVK